MNLATLEILEGIDFYIIILLVATFFIMIPINRTKRVWSHFLPLVAAALYVPYEVYFRIPEVSLGVPIRVDLLLLLPVFGFTFPIATLMWGLVTLRQRKIEATASITAPFMAIVMLACTIAWPVYIRLYFKS